MYIYTCITQHKHNTCCLFETHMSIVSSWLICIHLVRDSYEYTWFMTHMHTLSAWLICIHLVRDSCAYTHNRCHAGSGQHCRLKWSALILKPSSPTSLEKVCEYRLKCINGFHEWVYIHMYTYLYVYIHTYMCVYIHICVYICMHTCMYTYIHIYMCKHICMCVCVRVCMLIYTYM